MSGIRGCEPGESNEWLEELSRNHRSYRERLAQELCRTFRSYRLSASEAEDLADLALAKAVAKIGQFDSRKNAKFTTWLHRIARLCALDFVQSAERRRVTENVDDGKVRQRMPSMAGPAEAYELARLSERLQAAVAALPKGRRDAVCLCEFEGLFHEAAAAEMGVPLRRLRQLLYEGRATLGRNPELRRLYYGCDFSRKEARARKSRNRGDDGVRG
jgi:RNA polymerase sigma factor (sigma-70 family)